MFRVFAIVSQLFLAVSVGGLFQSGVTVVIDAPREVVAGTEFEVRINIQKGDLESFSRLQQTFPAGLTASSYLSSNADFSFEEKRVRMIWLRLPNENEFSVVYRIKVDERLVGTFDIKGKFSYIEENERKSVSVESTPINILPSPDIDPALIVDINEFEDKVIPFIPPALAGSQIACIRQIPQPEADGYIVNILVNKESKQNFAKIEEQIPAGYTAVNVDPKQAIFTFQGGMAKFLWWNLPPDPYFTVTYKLIPTGAGAPAPSMKGKFSYLEGEKTFSMDIIQTDQELANLSPDQISMLIATAGSAPITQSKTPQETRVIPGAKTPSQQTNISYLLEPEDGVYYRVQLAAGHKEVDIQRYFRKYNLDKEVRAEVHEGWHKYSIGSFDEYKDARDYRVHIWNTTVIDDAFVSAYNNGKRITVQEALMIANQTWYR